MGVRGGGFLSPEMFKLITHPRMLAAAGSLLGSGEIVASAYRIRPKLPNFGRGVVPWHQDSGYLSEHCDESLIITCWVPFVDATKENGCMEILPRTHRGKVVPHHTGGNADFLVHGVIALENLFRVELEHAGIGTEKRPNVGLGKNGEPSGLHGLKHFFADACRFRDRGKRHLLLLTKPA